MKKLIAIIMLLAFAVGCAPQGIPEIEIHVGTQGLVANFEQNSPPDTAFEGDAIPISIMLRNLGTHNIENGYYSIAVEKALMSLEGESTDTFSINGKSQYDTIGGQLMIRKGAFVGNLGPMTEVITSTISTTFCYEYRTVATANVCIDTDVFNQNPQKVCRTADVEFSEGGQGAPVAMSRVEPKMKQHPTDRNKIIPQFLIYIKNVGNGQCIEPSKIRDACTSGSVPVKYWNTAVVKAYLIDRELDCRPKLDPASTSPEGHIKFSRDVEREDYIVCELAEGIDRTLGTYTSTLKVEVDYGYTSTISRSMLIKKLAGN